LDPFEEFDSPACVSVNFLLDLVKCRKKSMFVPVIQFLSSALAIKVGTDFQKARQKDGALFYLGSISKVLMSSELGGQINSVLHSTVVPELQNQNFGFLRMRACWALEQFDSSVWSQEMVEDSLRGVLNCLKDSELPVRVASCGALTTLLDNDLVLTMMPPVLPQVIESILLIASQIQMDTVAFTLERLVQMFSQNLTPYAVQLAMHLKTMVLKSLEGYTNALEYDEEKEGFTGEADKMMALVGMFKTIDTLVESMKKTPEIVASLEEIILPLLGFVLENGVIDVYEEVFELFDSIVFARKTVSPLMWTLLPLLLKVYAEVGPDYVETMYTCFDNLISYGSQFLLSSSEGSVYLNGIIETVITKTMAEESADGLFCEEDKEYICKLMESIMLNCRGHVDSLIPHFLRILSPSFLEISKKPSIHSISLVISYLEVILNALYYNPSITMQCIKGSISQPFMDLLKLRYSKMTRVHDLRILILGILSILQTPKCEISPCFLENIPMLISILVPSIAALPKALENRKKLQESELLSDGSDSEEENFAEEQDYDEINDDVDEISTGQIPTKGNQYDDEDSDFSDDGSFLAYDDDLEEDLFFETPLDSLDFASLVQNTIKYVYQQQADLLKDISSEHVQFIGSLL
jgi:hypothetical protein